MVGMYHYLMLNKWLTLRAPASCLIPETITGEVGDTQAGRSGEQDGWKDESLAKSL